MNSNYFSSDCFNRSPFEETFQQLIENSWGSNTFSWVYFLFSEIQILLQQDTKYKGIVAHHIHMIFCKFGIVTKKISFTWAACVHKKKNWGDTVLQIIQIQVRWSSSGIEKSWVNLFIVLLQSCSSSYIKSMLLHPITELFSLISSNSPEEWFNLFKMYILYNFNAK